MSQKSMLKSDILKILAKDISGGRRGETQPIIPGIISNKDSGNRPTFESAKNPRTFFGGQNSQSNQPYYPSAQEPNPAANPMTPIVPGIISDKKPGSRKTYKSSKTPKTFFGGAKDPKCIKAEQEVVKFCAKPKAKRAPSAYNLFVKKYFKDNPAATITSAAAAWKRTKSKPSGPRPQIKLTSFGDVPPPPSSPPPQKKAPKKRKLKIVPPEELKKPAAAKKPAAKKPAAKKPAAKKPAAKKAVKKVVKPVRVSSSPSLADELRSAALDAEFGGAKTHVMPDGTVHTGKTHTIDSREVAGSIAVPADVRPPMQDTPLKMVKAGGKSIPKKQLKSASGPMSSKSRKNSTWLTHLAEFRKNNKNVKAKDVFREAKKTYKKPEKKSGGAHCGGVLVLDPVPTIEVDNNKIESNMNEAPKPAEKKDIPIVKQIMEEKRAGVAPPAPDKKSEMSEKDQNKLSVDILSSYDEYNKRFQDISNSNMSADGKRTEYNNERTRLETYHNSVIKNYSEVLSADKMKLIERAYNYANETYKIGLSDIKSGAPQQRVEFENFDDNDTITQIIDERLAFPRGPLDRAKSFYSVAIKDSPIQNFKPFISKLGSMASIYPYGYQLAEKAMRAGAVKKAKKTPKEILKKLTKEMFLRDMKRRFPNISDKRIMEVFEKNKSDIKSLVTDAIVDMMEVRGGADCGPNQYTSGDRCFDKQPRMEKFDKDQFFMEKKREADAKDRKDDGSVMAPLARPLPSKDMGTKTSADPANPLPNPKPQDNSEKNFVEKFSAAVTPSEKGAIFGTDGRDISDPKAWVDSLANIFVSTADGVGTIFEALGDLF